MADKLDNNETPSLSEESRIKLKAAKYDFWKFLIGTVVLGLAGMASTAIFKNYELKIASRTSENQYMNAYINQYTSFDKGDSVRKYERIIEMFHVLSVATTDDVLQEKWDMIEKYFQGKIDYLKDSIQHVAVAIEKKEEQVQQQQQEKRAVEKKLTDLKQQNDNTGTIEKLEERRNRLMESIADAQRKISTLAAVKLEADKYANERLMAPPTVIAQPESQYEVIYDLDRFTGVNYFSEIIEGIAVHVNGYNENTNTVNITVDWNDKSPEHFELKADNSSKKLFFDNKNISVTLTLKSFARRSALGKKVANYRIIVQKKLDAK